MDDAIAAYIAKGMTRKQACATLGIPYTPEIQHSGIDKDSLRDMAIDTLASLIRDMQANPSAFKPQEIIAACREALDRTEGKAAQTIAVESKATVTHEHILKLDPAEAYRRLIEDDVRVVDITPKKTALPAPGGSAAKQGPGVNEGETPPDNNNQPSPFINITEAPWK